MGRFVTAFGAASVDPQLPELQEGHWPALDWSPIAAAVGARRRSLHHLAPPERTGDGPAWAETTRQAQADVLRTTIETLRKIKYQPTGGFCAFYLADPGPAGGFGVLDSDRRAKPALQALTDACRPVIVVGEPLPASVGVGEVCEIAIHVVSDLHEPLRDGVVTATIHHADGTTGTHRWGGEIEADSVARISLLSVPALRPGALTVELVFKAVEDNAKSDKITAHSSVKTTVC
jgi:beta-mannosidase